MNRTVVKQIPLVRKLADKVAQIAELEAALAAERAAREAAEKNYQFMVDRAAEQHLDGYRELGAKCAALEERAEQAERERDAAADLAREEAARLCDLIGYDWRDGGMEQKQYAAEYLAKEIRATITDPESVRRTLDDAEMFVWYFSWNNKSADFVSTYLRGMEEHWSLDQWRAAIAARKGEEGK